MIDLRSIYQASLAGLLSLSAAVQTAATGNALQALLLRALGVKLKGPVAFLPGATFVHPENLRLGRFVMVGTGARLVCWDEVSIGDDFLASDRLIINSGTHDPETVRPRNIPVRIGDRVWCGSNVTICAGVTVGDDVVIGAGSVVVKDLPGGCVAAGTPCRPLRELRRGPDTLLWSPWPERSGPGPYARSTPLVRLLYRLRFRL